MNRHRQQGPTRLEPCPNRPNCVSSLAPTGDHFVEPLQRRGPDDLHELSTLLAEIAGCAVITVTAEYLHAEFRSLLLRFVDDFELLVDTDKDVIQVRSASRLGYYDFNANRKRVESVRSLWSSWLQADR